MKKIFFLMDHFKNPFAGTEGQLYALVKGLNEMQISTELAVFHSSEYINSRNFPCKVKVLNITKMLHIMTLVKLIKLALYCRLNEFNLVHIYFNDASVIAPIILRLFGLKVIISRRDMGYWYNSKLLKILRLNAKFHQGCICNSEAVKKITVQQEHIPEHLVHVVYNGVPENKVDYTDTVYDLNQIGLVANIRSIKRIKDLIKALKVVKKSVPGATVVVVGSGDATHLIALAKRYGVEKSVKFVGAQNDVSAFIKKFQVAVMCSETEGLSNAILEYMAHQKPVVCSDVGGNSELIVHGKNGYLYPVGNVSLLAENIIKLLQNTDRAEKYGKIGFERIITDFTLEKMIADTVDVYRKILKNT